MIEEPVDVKTFINSLLLIWGHLPGLPHRPGKAMALKGKKGEKPKGKENWRKGKKYKQKDIETDTEIYSRTQRQKH